MSIVSLLADQMTVPENPGEGAPAYRMFIRDLVLLCRIGVYAHEKLRAQRVRINVSMRVQPDMAPRNDDIANVLSYDQVLGEIKRLAAGGHINLVETLAETPRCVGATSIAPMTGDRRWSRLSRATGVAILAATSAPRDLLRLILGLIDGLGPKPVARC